MLGGASAATLTAAIVGYKILKLRTIVPADMVHIVQSVKNTTSYGKDQKDENKKDTGNVYYKWPQMIPVLGVVVKQLPVSNFDIRMDNFEAYDKDRVPFNVDVSTFFRIADTNKAAERVASFDELRNHLTVMVHGSVRSIMANAKLEEIMEQRSTYGEKFTKEVEDQLKAWGVEPVKNIELMDIRDTKESTAIANIMKKKQSEIAKESRTTVALNNKEADMAEIDAEREVEVKRAEKEQLVGERNAEKNRVIGIANEQQKQLVAEQEKITAEKDLEITRVKEITNAEIAQNKSIIEAETTRKTAVIKADQDKETMKIKAEADKEKMRIDTDAKKYETETIADADKLAKEKNASAHQTMELAKAAGIKATGEASADAEKMLQLARVVAEKELAETIGSNKEYQEYLINLEKVKKNAEVAIKTAEYNSEVGKEQAKNLNKADIKIITNTSDGNVGGGVSKVMDLFSSKGGQAVNGMLETLSNTDMGKGLLEKIGVINKGKQDQVKGALDKQR